MPQLACYTRKIPTDELEEPAVCAEHGEELPEGHAIYFKVFEPDEHSPAPTEGSHVEYTCLDCKRAHQVKLVRRETPFDCHTVNIKYV